MSDAPVYLGGRYRLEDRLGRGGAGEVWAAADTVLGRRVAVKLLRSDLTHDATTGQRFRREATSAARLGHPNAVTIYDIGDDDDQPYLVMELVDGPSLESILGDGPLDVDTVAAIGAQVASALDAAHVQGLVHRDVKPGNVLISSTGIAKVADFGVAKALGDAAATLTDDGTVVGTAAYLAPEQVAGGDIGAATDIYALGLVLWEALTGRRPFGSGTVAEVTSRRLATDVPPVEQYADVPAPLAAAIRTATRRAPEDRYPDAGAFAAALVACAPEDPVPLIAGLADGSRAPRHDERTAVLERTVAHDALGTTRAVPVEPAPATSGSPQHTADDQASTQAHGTTQMAPVAAAPPRPVTDTPPPDGPAGRAAPATGDAADPSHGHDRRAWLWLLAVPVVALVVIGLIGDGGGDGGDATTDGETQAASAGPLTVAGATDHDPFGGDGEHPEDTPLAFDGDAGTGWTTQRYDTAAFGGLKTGVGLVLDLGSPAAVKRVELELGIPGAGLEVYALDEPPSGDPDTWGEAVGGLEEAPSSGVIELEEALERRYWLVWFTSLPADGGRHRTTIQEARFFGP